MIEPGIGGKRQHGRRHEKLAVSVNRIAIPAVRLEAGDLGSGKNRKERNGTEEAYNNASSVKMAVFQPASLAAMVAMCLP